MLLIALAILLGAWALVVAVTLCLCIAAARADREAYRRRTVARASRSPVVRLIAQG